MNVGLDNEQNMIIYGPCFTQWQAASTKIFEYAIYGPRLRATNQCVIDLIMIKFGFFGLHGGEKNVFIGNFHVKCFVL